MTWATIGAAAVSAAAGSGKQLGAPAPVFNPGGGVGFDPIGLSEGVFGQQGAVQQLGNTGIQGLFGNNLLESLIGKPEERGQELAPQVRANEFAGPPNVPAEAAEGTPGFVGPSATPAEQDELGPFSKFFGNLDQNLQSPSKLIGLSLLSQIDPRLAQAGLFAGGLFGQNKF